jgi:hypothetical protein
MSNQKQRHGCLTALLIIIIIANSIGLIGNLIAITATRQTVDNVPIWVAPLLAVLSSFCIVCAIALFKWKKWGFYGYGISCLIASIVYLMYGSGILPWLAGLVSILILGRVLHIGKENKGWAQLH